jgi:PAS domain S-box-containing protein
VNRESWKAVPVWAETWAGANPILETWLKTRVREVIGFVTTNARKELFTRVLTNPLFVATALAAILGLTVCWAATPWQRGGAMAAGMTLAWILAAYVAARKLARGPAGGVEHCESQAERARLAAAIAQVAEAIVITDHLGTIEYVNAAFTRITGYTAEEAVGRNPRLLKSGSHDAAFYRSLWQAISAGSVWHGDLTNRRKDGRCYLEEMSITPVRDADGRITAYVAIKQDVTATRAAADSQGLLASIVECSEDAIIAYTTAAIIVSWNRSAEKLFG